MAVPHSARKNHETCWGRVIINGLSQFWTLKVTLSTNQAIMQSLHWCNNGKSAMAANNVSQHLDFHYIYLFYMNVYIPHHMEVREQLEGISSLLLCMSWIKVRLSGLLVSYLYPTNSSHWPNNCFLIGNEACFTEGNSCLVL